MTEALSRAEVSAGWLRDEFRIDSVDETLVMGSGWGTAANLLGETLAEVPRDAVPGFASATVAGHAGLLRLIRKNDKLALVQLGRTHLYEGHGVAAVAHGVRTAAALGAKTCVLTNAAGGLRPGWQVGQPVLIRDHINLTSVSPLDGPTFVDMTDVYTPRLREECLSLDPTLEEGVYVQFRGPQYETPAEIAMVKSIGGDLVGMSTTIEAIAARALGMQILGISLVTNLAAGLSDKPLDHKEVLAAGEASAERMGRLLASII